MISGDTARYLSMTRSLVVFFDWHRLSWWSLLMISRWRSLRTRFWMISLIGFCPVSSRYRNMLITISYVPHIMPDLTTKLTASSPTTAGISISTLFQTMRSLATASEYPLDPIRCEWWLWAWLHWSLDVKLAILGRCWTSVDNSWVQLSCKGQTIRWAHLRLGTTCIWRSIQPAWGKTHWLTTVCFKCLECWTRLPRLICKASTNMTNLQCNLSRRAWPKHYRSVYPLFVALCSWPYAAHPPSWTRLPISLMLG